MSDGGAYFPPAQVVVLAKDNSYAAELNEDVCICAHAPSCYEAAALLLSRPTSAIVIQLSMLGPRHLRLLEIARQLGVEILGFGNPHSEVSVAQLSGVRLTSPADLPKLLEQVLALSHKSNDEDTATLNCCLVEDADITKQKTFAGETNFASQSEQAAPQPEKLHVEIEHQPQHTRPPVGEFKSDSKELGAKFLLTPEELSALLEEEL